MVPSIGSDTSRACLTHLFPWFGVSTWLPRCCAFCSSNLNEQGKLTTNSVWKRPAPPKKTVTKRTAKTQSADAPPPKKRRKKSTETAVAKQAKKPRKKKAKDDDTPPAKKVKKIHLKLPKSGSGATKPSTLGGADAATSPGGGDDHDDHVPPQHGNSDTEDEDDSEVEDGDGDGDEEDVDEYGYNPDKAREDHEAEFRRLQRMGAEYSHAAMMVRCIRPRPEEGNISLVALSFISWFLNFAYFFVSGWLQHTHTHTHTLLFAGTGQRTSVLLDLSGSSTTANDAIL